MKGLSPETVLGNLKCDADLAMVGFMGSHEFFRKI